MPMVVAFGGSSRVSALSFALRHWLRIEARIADGVEGQSGRCLVGVDLQRPRAELKPREPIQRLQRPTNLRPRRRQSIVAMRNTRPWLPWVFAAVATGCGSKPALRMASSARARRDPPHRSSAWRAPSWKPNERIPQRFQSPPISDLFGTAVHGGDSNSLPWPGLFGFSEGPLLRY